MPHLVVCWLLRAGRTSRQAATRASVETLLDRISTEKRSALMASVRSRNTKPELVVRSLIHRLGFRFRLHRSDLPGCPDLVFPSRRIAMFVHGCFWHQHICARGAPPVSNADFWRRKLSRNRERDGKVTRLLKKDGWRVIVIWECETKNEERLARRVSRALNS